MLETLQAKTESATEKYFLNFSACSGISVFCAPRGVVACPRLPGDQNLVLYAHLTKCRKHHQPQFYTENKNNAQKERHTYLKSNQTQKAPR